ncbi:hypothetical protein BGZ49_007563 [Haplosporangium sp. Z 27]|nr:hypothetical protein BGZ49_007563 [Haplosporangium sp. Z 27]
MEHPMEHPDIRLYIAEYLNTAQLAVVAVKTNGEYMRMARLKTRDRIRQIAFQNHAVYVREIKVAFSDCPYGKAASLDAFTRLERLELNFHNYLFGYSKFVSRVLRYNPGLLSLKINAGEGDSPSQLMRTLVDYCPKLKVFQGSLRLGVDDLNYFFSKSYNQLEIFTLDGSISTGSSKLQIPQQFPNITEFRFGSPTQQHKFLKRCPRLAKLVYDMYGRSAVLPTLDIYNLLRKHCPLVHGLSIDSCSWTDFEFTGLINCCQSDLTHVNFFATKFGPGALQSLLEQHTNSLTLLNVMECHAITSPHNIQILTTFPNLIEFRGTSIKAQDILGASEDDVAATDLSQIKPPEWICKNLRRFRGFICGLRKKPSHWNRLVLEQLAKLERLEKLDISPSGSEVYKTPLGNGGSVDSLDIRLAGGMDVLSSLRQLRELMCFQVEMKMDLKDVEWVVKNWPNLKKIQGDVHFDHQKRKPLVEILKEHGVEVDTMGGGVFFDSLDSRSRQREIKDSEDYDSFEEDEEDLEEYNDFDEDAMDDDDDWEESELDEW